MKSLAPPGGNGATIRIARLGYEVCPHAGAVMTAMAATARTMRVRCAIHSLPDVSSDMIFSSMRPHHIRTTSGRDGDFCGNRTRSALSAVPAVTLAIPQVGRVATGLG